jgi:hypothetical protein
MAVCDICSMQLYMFSRVVITLIALVYNAAKGPEGGRLAM